MAKFQIRKRDQVGFIVIPKSLYKFKKWKQGTLLDIIEGYDGSLIIREIKD